ncbi:MAG: hypothetical protein RL101_673, partial [Actinomycetota bacterium]
IANNQKVLVGTSGWSAHHLQQIEAQLNVSSAEVVVVTNFSIGSMLGSKFAAEAAQFFDSIEIVEAHHAGKIDSPSGTAVRTAEMISAARDGKSILLPGVGQTARGQVVAGVPIHSLRLEGVSPIHSLRLEGVSAKQEVLLGGDSEVLKIAHEVTSIRSYVTGILKSLEYTAGAKGLTVGLQSVLGL